MSNFNEQLPVWNAAGVEPPAIKKSEGWKPGEKPPADYWNWFMNRAYKVLQELQLESAAQTDVDILNDQILDQTAPTALNLGYGLQVINSSRVAPYNVMSFSGRTLVNILGRDGGCESLTPFTPGGTGAVSSSLDTTRSKSGRASIKIVTSAANPTQYRMKNYEYKLDTAKQYLFSAWVYIESFGSGGQPSIILCDYNTTTGRYQTSATTNTIGSWQFIYLKVPKNNILVGNGFRLFFGRGSDSAFVANFDNISLYEISDAEATAIDSMTNAQVAAKYPYVDDMQGVLNPYIIKYGENLILPFTSSWWRKHANAKVLDPNTLQLDATGASQVSYLDVPAVPLTSYTLSAEMVSASAQPIMNIYSYNAAGVGTYLGEIWPATPTKTVTTRPDTVALRIQAFSQAAGKSTFGKLMLTPGSAAKPFVPREDNYLFFHTRWCSNVDGSVADQLYRKGEDYYKLERFRTMDPDGSVPWMYADTGTSVKLVKLQVSSSISYDKSAAVIKYDGKILKNREALGWQVDGRPLDTFNIWNDGWLYLSVPMADSGWPDAFQPIDSDVQRYFNGWKMCNSDGSTPYSGTGTRYWKSIIDGSTVTSNTDLTATTRVVGYSPYRLQYQLDKPVSKKALTEGDITLHAGMNQIEVGNGMIVRNRANPVYTGGFDSWYINRDSSGSAGVPSGSELTYRTSRILTIYKGGVEDDTWAIAPSDNASYGTTYAETLSRNFDRGADYSATYLALDQHSLTCNIQTMQGQYDANLKTNVDALSKGQADITKRVSVLEATKSQKYQPQWITPTLMNGWTQFGDSNYDKVRYYKDDQGYVHIKGLMTGSTYQSKMFILPIGYRPAANRIYLLSANDSTSDGWAKVTIGWDGVVIHGSGFFGWVSLGDICFLAEG